MRNGLKMSDFKSRPYLYPVKDHLLFFNFLNNNFKLLEEESAPGAGWNLRVFYIEYELSLMFKTSETSSGIYSYYGFLPVSHNEVRVINKTPLNGFLNLEQVLGNYISEKNSKLFLYNIDLFT